MANTKISALTSATTPLAGTETLPIVQSSATVKVATNDLTVRNIRANATTGILQVTGPAAASTRVVTVPDANFTAARTDAAQSFTGNQTLSTGNLVIGTAGQGIDFSANTGAAGMTSELLTWYEEGTFTPVLTSSGGGVPTYDFRTGKYTRIGNTVHFFVEVYLTSLGTLAAGNLDITGLPFNASGYETVIIDYSSFTSSIISVFARTNPSAANLTLYYQVAAATNFGNALTQGNISATSGMRISGTYFV